MIAIVLLGHDREVIIVGLLELHASTVGYGARADLRKNILAAFAREPFALDGLRQNAFGQTAVVIERIAVELVIVVRTVAIRIAEWIVTRTTAKRIIIELVVVIRTIAVRVAVWTVAVR